MFKKTVTIIGYSVFIIMMFDLPSHKVFNKCINPINLIVSNIIDRNPNEYGNKVVGNK